MLVGLIGPKASQKKRIGYASGASHLNCESIESRNLELRGRCFSNITCATQRALALLQVMPISF